MTTMTSSIAYDVASRSLNRCNSSKGFLESFYSTLRDSHPDIAPMFATTDFVKQNELLRASLSIMLMFDHGGDTVHQALAEIRESHSRHRLNVKPELYVCWVDSLMKACREHDSEFTADVEAAWREILAKGISYIVSGYDEGISEDQCMSYLRWIDPDLEAVARSWHRLSDSARDTITTEAKATT